MKKVSMILATDSKNWIWKKNNLPWKIQNDMKHFQKITISTKDPKKCNALIMWRKTWESIAAKFRPLPGRVNCVLSRTVWLELDWGICFTNFEDCFAELSQNEMIENIFIIGWSHLYNSLIDHPQVEKIYLTHVEWDFECDVFFNWVPRNFSLHKISSKQDQNGHEYYFAEYKKKKY